MTEEYIEWFEWAVRDLPWKTKRDLAGDLRAHIAELPPDSRLDERLGSPEQYAADLRAAAGLDRRRGVVAFVRSFPPRSLVIFAAVVAALGLAVTGVVWGHNRNAWINSYQPLDFAFGSRYPPGKSLLGLDGVQATFRAGRPFNFGITVINDGRFTVRILGVPFGGGYDPWKARLMMSRTLADTGGMHGPYVPFHPFDLAPDRVVFLFFKGRYACHGRQAAEAQTYNDFPVRYAFRGRTATASIPLPEPFAVYIPKGCR